MGHEATAQRLHQRLDAYMTERGLRSTAQRRLVTDTFFHSSGHLTVDDLLGQVRQTDPKVGYATVYRTLKLLKECGVAFERHFEDGIARYEVANEDEHHDHLICTSCHAIIEFEEPEIERLQELLAKRHGFLLQGHRHELYGVCASPQDCRRTAEV